MLAVENLSRHFEGLVAVDTVSFRVAPGSVHALIGPNGAGKTTLFNLVSGLMAVSGGSIRFQGVDVTHLPAHRCARLGMGRTFQNLRVFGDMTVLENVLTGMHPRLGVAWPLAILRASAARAEERRAQERGHALLARVGIDQHARRRAADLAYGDQRRLEIARALAADPALLLLDEPAAGMNPTETAALAELLRGLKADGLTILLVEHDMGFVMRLSDTVTVLNFGKKIAEGPPDSIRADPVVVEAYLGPRMAKRLLQEAH
jgi:branched-chain amino acid transport system ATP-binding protein